MTGRSMTRNQNHPTAKNGYRFIGHLSTFYHTAIILMANEDTDARLGCRIEWRLFGTGPAIVNAFEKGDIDLAYIGLPPAIIGIERGVNIICIAGGHIEGTVIAGGKMNISHRQWNS
jgi:NitT/TauT family transport system substrate-binding protein